MHSVLVKVDTLGPVEQTVLTAHFLVPITEAQTAAMVKQDKEEPAKEDLAVPVSEVEEAVLVEAREDSKVSDLQTAKAATVGEPEY